jgi:hypothetical protein
MTFAEFFTLSTPTRRIAIAKYLTTTKKNKKNRQIDEKEKATNILNEFIHSSENVFYPAAFYYWAFLRLKQGNLDKKEEEKDEFIRISRSAKTILNMQINPLFVCCCRRLQGTKTKQQSNT